MAEIRSRGVAIGILCLLGLALLLAQSLIDLPRAPHPLPSSPHSLNQETGATGPHRQLFSPQEEASQQPPKLKDIVPLSSIVRHSARRQRHKGGHNTHSHARHSRLVSLGGEEGWTVRYYPPVSVLVGDVLNFTWREDPLEEHVGGHDVWHLPTQQAFDTCDFLAEGAVRLGVNHVQYRVHRAGDHFFACSVLNGSHCRAGHKVKVVASRGRWISHNRRRHSHTLDGGTRASIARSAGLNPQQQQQRIKAHKILDPGWESTKDLGRSFDETLQQADAMSARRRGATGRQVGGEGFGPQQAQQPNIAWCGQRVAWDSRTAFASFEMFGCIGVSGIHTQETFEKTIVVIDRTDSVNTVLKLPGPARRNAYGEELQFTTGDPVNPAVEKPLDVKTNLFCSTGQVVSDGRLISIGGSTDAVAPDPLLNGSYSIRAFRPPCLRDSCDFEVLGDLTDRRWYPTAQLLGNGRILIVGGSNTTGNIAINNPRVNNPTVEYWPRRPGERFFTLQFLIDTVPYNLYAFVHLLPSGLVFIFASDTYILYNTTTNLQVPGTYPPLSVMHDLYPAPVKRSYPIAGTSAMFPLDPDRGWEAEIMVCGGASTLAVPLNGGSVRDSIRNIVWMADHTCFRIKPEAPTPTWVPDHMCDTPACNVKYRRVMGDALLLVDGSMLVINGAAQGFQGLTNNGGFARTPQLQPVIYRTSNYTWYPVAQLPASRVPRLYHASALLVHDGSVIVTGGNPNTGIRWPGGSLFPTEFRVERFLPPYLTTGQPRPVLTQAPRAVSINSLFAIYFTSTRTSRQVNLRRRFNVTLVYPGFSTHNQRHGMRNVNLAVNSVLRVRGTTFIAVIRSPPTLNHCPPTLYWLHVLDEGIPNVGGRALNITRSERDIGPSLRKSGGIIISESMTLPKTMTNERT